MKIEKNKTYHTGRYDGMMEALEILRQYDHNAAYDRILTEARKIIQNERIWV